MIGTPVTVTTDSAAPPRASPSSLVRTTPSKPTPSWKAFAVATASWPIIASTTSSVSSGWTASRTWRSCSMSAVSMARRPAVSTMTTSCWVSLAISTPSRATSTGSPHVASGFAPVLPGCGAKTGAPARSATTDSWSTAFGRCRSAATSIGRVALLLEVHGQLAGQGGLARALQAGEQDDGGRILGELQPTGLAAEQLDELLVDDLDDLLRGVQRARDLRPDGTLTDAIGEHAHCRQGHVGLEQGDPDLPDRVVDVGLGQPALAAQALEGRGQPVGEGCEHNDGFYRGVRAPPPRRSRQVSVRPTGSPTGAVRGSGLRRPG